MKKRVGVIKMTGLSGGGCEKYIQTIVMSLPKDEFSVDYFYTDSFPAIGTDMVHAGTDPKRKKLMEDAGINLIEVSLPLRENGYPGRWLDTNLFTKFNEKNYDVLLSVTKGEPEWPFCEMKTTPQIETIHGSTFDTGASTGAAAFVLLADWQRSQWVRRGGPMERSVVIPSLVAPPVKTSSTIRKELGIPDNAFVVGMHQANRDDIHSPVPLKAFALLQMETDCHFILLGGSTKYKEQATALGLNNVHFVPFDSSPTFISNVLGALDVYAHGRSDGEVCSASIIEALYHGLPVVSVYGTNNGHIEQILGAGAVVETAQQYGEILISLASNAAKRDAWAAGARARYEWAYRFDLNCERIINLIRSVCDDRSFELTRI